MNTSKLFDAPRRAIKKVTISVTVLVDDDLYSDSDLSKYPLEVIAHEIDEGDWLGTYSVTSVEDVPEDKVRDECIAVGNDGTFFDYDY